MTSHEGRWLPLASVCQDRAQEPGYKRQSQNDGGIRTSASLLFPIKSLISPQRPLCFQSTVCNSYIRCVNLSKITMVPFSFHSLCCVLWKYCWCSNFNLYYFALYPILPFDSCSLVKKTKKKHQHILLFFLLPSRDHWSYFWLRSRQASAYLSILFNLIFSYFNSTRK